MNPKNTDYATIHGLFSANSFHIETHEEHENWIQLMHNGENTDTPVRESCDRSEHQ